MHWDTILFSAGFICYMMFVKVGREKVSGTMDLINTSPYAAFSVFYLEKLEIFKEDQQKGSLCSW